MRFLLIDSGWKFVFDLLLFRSISFYCEAAVVEVRSIVGVIMCNYF